MSEGESWRRGDVVLVSLPFVSDPSRRKLRPAVIVQNDIGNRFSANLIVVPISSRLSKREYPTNLILRRDAPESETTGLDRDFVVQAEAILTIPKDTVSRRLGRFTGALMRAVDRCLKVSLALS